MDVNDLRDELFQALKDLRAGKINAEQAKGISEIGQTIVNSAKVEVDYARVTEQRSGSGFIPDEKQQRKLRSA